MSASGIVRILPGAVAAVESFGDRTDATLLPEEEPAVTRAVDERRREFTTTRHCARIALCQLGLAPVAIPVGDRRQPIWPHGVVGSLTHCAGYRAAAVAHDAQLASLGIDAEPNAPLPPDVLGLLTNAAERTMLEGLPTNGVHWDRLLFSAKEAVYKSWFPLTNSWLGFDDVELVIDPEQHTFVARFLVPGPVASGVRLDSLHGRWNRCDGLLLATTTAPVPD